MSQRSKRRRDESGSITLETVILAPALIFLLNLVIVLGRVAIVHSFAQQAAQAAARAGSMARDPNKAAASVSTAYSAIVGDNSDVICPNTPYSSGNPAFYNVPGTAAAVGTDSMFVVSVSCTIPVSKLPGFKYSITITVTAYSPLDPYRCNGGGGVC